MLLLFVLTIALVIIFATLIKRHWKPNPAPEAPITSEEESEKNTPEPEVISTENSPELEPETSVTDLQALVDAWMKSLPAGASAGIMIYDLDYDTVVAKYQSDLVFGAASLYKLFFIYDGYLQIAQGADDPDEHFVNTADKGGLSLITCLDLMMRESYNGCADPMRDDPKRYQRVETMIDDLKLSKTSKAGLYTSAEDITTLLRLYYQHPQFDETTWNRILDSMLNQPATTDDWRQGLPSGFKVAKVYDKVGWEFNVSRWKIYNDAAIINFPEQNKNYIVVILTENLPNASYLAQLGQMLETAVLNAGA